MGGGATRQDSLIIEVETTNPAKNPDALDISLPRLRDLEHRYGGALQTRASSRYAAR